MNLCDDGHQEVCFEGRNCPACEFKHDLHISEEHNEELKDRIERLEDEIKALENS